MIKSLIKSTNEVRIETIEEVKEYQEKMREQAAAGGYQLSNYSWTEKEVKVKGEVVETYFQVRYAFIFNNIKEPATFLKSIEYNMMDYVGE